jgi:hypothetical protein
MANQNNRQEGKNQQENNQGGFLNQVGETIENMVDTLTGDNQNNNQQGERNNQKNRS